MNLLPQKQKDDIYRDILIRFFSVALLIVSFWALIFLVLLYNSVVYLNLQIPAIEKRLSLERETQKANIVQTVEDEITNLNEILLRIDRIQKRGSFNFPYILRMVGGVMPSGTVLRSITFSGGNMTISGHANERLEVLSLKENLEEEQIFKDVDSPLSNIIKEQDIDFTFSFSLQDAESE